MNSNTQSTFLPGRTRYVAGRSRRPLKSRVVERIASLKHLGWDLGVVIMERVSGHRRDGGALDVRLAASARDLVAQKSKAVMLPRKIQPARGCVMSGPMMRR